jgi:queuosine precursor transporter
MKYLWLFLYIGTVLGANWAIGKYGLVPVGFGLMAPAGVYFAGLAFTARDMVRESIGKRGVFAAILVGAALSFFIEDIERIAMASAVAFLISETADSLAYEPLRRRWAVAVLVSNAVGLVIDSALFLWLAFGSLDFIEGQILGKAYMTIAAIPVIYLLRRFKN